MAKTFHIDGGKIYDIPTFYDEINRVFMDNENWKLGASLDALDDMFYGGYGNINGKGEIRIVWSGFEKNRGDLGVETTRRYYQDKLKSPTVFNTALIQRKLDELEQGTGKTYFDMVLDIIGSHKNIRLKAR